MNDFDKLLTPKMRELQQLLKDNNIHAMITIHSGYDVSDKVQYQNKAHSYFYFSERISNKDGWESWGVFEIFDDNGVLEELPNCLIGEDAFDTVISFLKKGIVDIDFIDFDVYPLNAMPQYNQMQLAIIIEALQDLNLKEGPHKDIRDNLISRFKKQLEDDFNIKFKEEK